MLNCPDGGGRRCGLVGIALVLMGGWCAGQAQAQVSVPGLPPELAASAVQRSIRQAAGSPTAHPRVIVGPSQAEPQAQPVAALLDSALHRAPAPAEAAQALERALAAADPLSRSQRYEQSLERLAEHAWLWAVRPTPAVRTRLHEGLSGYLRLLTIRGCGEDWSQARASAWSLALVLDLGGDALSQDERSGLLQATSQCLAQTLPAVLEALERDPRNGVAHHTLGRLIGALSLLLGDWEPAAGWLERSVPLYLERLSPWGALDGGYANGSSYLLWDVGESLVTWDLMRTVLGVPIDRHPWVQTLPTWLALTLPPGAAAGTFGDGAELRRTEEWGRFGLAVARRFDTPVSRWYAHSMRGGDPTRLQSVLGPPRPSLQADDVQALPNAGVFAGVGVAAFHSQLQDPLRTSVYFRSSPFGPRNHGHADQNSFLIHAAGEALATVSGDYDHYGSAHWRNWYKQTRAHNAVTWDGGTGQSLGPDGLGTGAPGGRLTDQQTSGDLQWVVGDAQAAYGPDTTKAIRAVLFMPPSTVVVIDQLEAQEARRWEWNLHTPQALDPKDGEYRLQQGRAQLCLRLDAPENLMLARVEPLPAPVGIRGSRPRVHSHRFSYERAQKAAAFVAILDTRCAAPTAAVRWSQAGGPELSLGPYRIRIEDGRVRLGPREGSEGSPP